MNKSKLNYINQENKIINPKFYHLNLILSFQSSDKLLIIIFIN